MAIVYLSFGSNLGDRVGYIQQAVALLKESPEISVVATSSFYETEPWHMDSNNWFVNAIVQISTTLSPENLLELCMKTESILGRKRETQADRYADRNIDIDIIFYDSQAIKTDNLIIPHPYFHKRAFMLIPMLEIAADFVHPIIGKSVEQIYDELENPEAVYLYGTRTEE